MKKVSVTKLESKVLNELIASLYAEVGFTDVEVADLARKTKMSKASVKGVVGSLVKKGLVESVDMSGSNVEANTLLMITPAIYHMHPTWKEEWESMCGAISDDEKIEVTEE